MSKAESGAATATRGELEERAAETGALFLTRKGGITLLRAHEPPEHYDETGWGLYRRSNTEEAP